MMNMKKMVIKKEGNKDYDLYLKTSNLWKTFEVITKEAYEKLECEEEKDYSFGKRYYKKNKTIYVTNNFYKTFSKKDINYKVSNEYLCDVRIKNERELKVGKICIYSNDFWTSYSLNKNNDFCKYVDKNVGNYYTKRYKKLDYGFIITDDFWYSYYYSLNSNNYLIDKNDIFSRRISTVSNGILVTNDFSESVNFFENGAYDSALYDDYFEEVGGKDTNKRMIVSYRLKDEYPIYKILFEHLDSFSHTNSGYGSAFEQLAMQTILKKGDVKDNLICSEKRSNDGGIDAMNLNGNIVDVYQIKFATCIERDEMEKFKKVYDNMEYIQRNEIDSIGAAQLKKYVERNSQVISKNFRIYLVGDNFKDSHKVEDNKYSINIKGNNYEYYYIDSYEIIRSFAEKSLACFDENSITTKNYHLTINKDREKEFVCNKDNSSYFMFLEAKEICKGIKNTYKTEIELDELFNYNVRGNLKRKNIFAKTISNNIDDKKLFSVYNNGISICCKSFPPIRNQSIISLDNPIVVNGQQTIIALYSAFLDGMDLDGIEVPVFIKIYGNNTQKMLDIAVANNTQNPVKELDLLSADIITRNLPKTILQICLQKKLKLEECFYLKIFSSGEKIKDKFYFSLFKKENIVELNDYYKALIPIILNEITEGNHEFHLSKFNKNSCKYRDELRNDKVYSYLKDIINDKNELLYNVIKQVVEAKKFVNNNDDYKPLENIIAIALYYGKSISDFKLFIENETQYLRDIDDKVKSTKDRIAYSSNSAFEKKFKEMLFKED